VAAASFRIQQTDLAFKYHHLFETDYKKRSDMKKYQVAVSESAVYRGTNELPKKTF